MILATWGGAVASNPGKSAEGSFRRLARAVAGLENRWEPAQRLARELRDKNVEKLRSDYAPKLTALEERIRKAQQRVEKEQSQAGERTTQAYLSVGSSLLGALLGRKAASAANVSARLRLLIMGLPLCGERAQRSICRNRLVISVLHVAIT